MSNSLFNIFPIFSSSKKESKVKPNLTLLVDIQSNRVRGTLVFFDGQNPPHILYSIVSPIAYKSHVNSDYTTKMMQKSLEEISQKISTEGMARARDKGHNYIKSVHYVLSTPWAISKSKTVKMHFDAETEITELMVKKIVDQERNELFEIFKKQTIDDHDVHYEFDVVFMEQKIFDIQLNGYSVTDYTGKAAKTLGIAFAFTLGSDKILKRIHSIVSKYVHMGEKESYHSALLLHYLASRSIFKNENDAEYVLIHVHGELTDIVVVKKGVTSYLTSFPFGTTTLVRKLAMAQKSSPETANSDLCIYEDGKVDDTQRKKMEKILLPIVKGWQAECSTALAGLGEASLLPKTFYLSSKHLDTFKKSLEEKHQEVTPFDKFIKSTDVTFEKTSEADSVTKIYVLALRDILGM